MFSWGRCRNYKASSTQVWRPLSCQLYSFPRMRLLPRKEFNNCDQSLFTTIVAIDNWLVTRISRHLRKQKKKKMETLGNRYWKWSKRRLLSFSHVSNSYLNINNFEVEMASIAFIPLLGEVVQFIINMISHVKKK